MRDRPLRLAEQSRRAISLSPLAGEGRGEGAARRAPAYPSPPNTFCRGWMQSAKSAKPFHAGSGGSTPTTGA